jgi:nicotinamide riboside transporter PnuC
MIQEILELTKGNLLKMALATIGILSIIFHILPKGEKKAGFFGLIGSAINFIKNIFKK